jgi:menaquinone-specific isochorismate synthase
MAHETAPVPRLEGLCAELSPQPLHGLDLGLSFFWSHPERGLRVRACGEVARREAGSGPAALGALLAALSRNDAVAWLDGAADARPRPPGPWFGAIAFDPAGPAWSGFAPVRFAAPEVLIWEEAGRSHAAAFAPEGEAGRPALQARLDAVRRQLELESAGAAVPRERPRQFAAHGRTTQDGRARWTGLVELALERIRAGALEKVVLARALDVPASRPPAELLRHLEQAYPSCRTFFLQGDGGAAFLGSTPENFCSLDGSLLRTEALAGSARPGEAAALLAEPKELREHAWVVDHIVSALRALADTVEVAAAPELRELATVAHLRTPISARLRPGVGLAQIVEALHPTPAVGGVPAPTAARFLADHEQLDRGLYAGLVGMVGPGRAELAVALRCALVRDGTARLFLGAGIVEGSSPEAEWVETQLKARALLDALGAPP